MRKNCFRLRLFHQYSTLNFYSNPALPGSSLWSWSEAWVKRNFFKWLGVRMSWPLQNIWPVELTIQRYYQSKTLQLRLTNGEVMTYYFWHKRATQSMWLRRHVFKEGCPCLLLNHFVPSEFGVLVSSLTAFLKMKDDAGFRKSIFFIWITAIVAQILKKCPHDYVCSVILIPNLNSVCQKGEFITIKMIKKTKPTNIAAVKLKECLQCLWNDTKLYDKEWWWQRLHLIILRSFVQEVLIHIRNQHSSFRKATHYCGLQFTYHVLHWRFSLLNQPLLLDLLQQDQIWDF